MPSSLYHLLERLRVHAQTEREKGTYFEAIAQAYFEHDDTQRGLYDKVWAYADWAGEEGISKADTGIDLVARLSDGSGLCAIQCKFYDRTHVIQKGDLDSFMAASGKTAFKRRIFIDTTTSDLGKNAASMVADQSIEFLRIGLDDLEKSRIDWSVFAKDRTVVLADKKTPFPHQIDAIAAVRAGLEDADRGKLIMACGTGKTFTALKIAEDLAGAGTVAGNGALAGVPPEHREAGKRVLFLVPSLALMSQTVTEWKNDAGQDFRAFAVCSDAHVGKRTASDDVADLEQHDLAFPATTDAKHLAEQVAAPAPDMMTVVFATYHSIQVISDAQLHFGLAEFDLIICDEAHRTTGATLEGEDSSNFVKVHDQAVIGAKKRLYMTATPRIFGESVKKKATEVEAVLASMDDAALFGETLFERGFSWAVQNNLLTDYKVIVLAVDEGLISSTIQNRLSSGSQLVLDDATKIIGCYKALTKETLKQDIGTDTGPMRRALAFCNNIKTSKRIQEEFSDVVSEYLTGGGLFEEPSSDGPVLNCEIEHVDGTFNAKSRTRLLDWLKEDANAGDAGEDTCRILTNVRCLSEGVDVPALDAIMFLHPRKSQIDVVQSVGRVMRKAAGKKMGYVILPVGIPAGVSPEQALNNNETYRVVWQILNALRAHDDRFDATINKAGLGEDVSDRIEIVGITREEQAATTAVVETLPSTPKAPSSDIGGGAGREDDVDSRDPAPEQTAFVFDEFAKAIMAKIVKKCGTRSYWEDWAGDIARIAQTHIARITAIVAQAGSDERQAFLAFLEEIRDDLNPEISEADAVEMLAQHLITKPVFDTLFKDNRFTKNNPVSRAMEAVLAQLHQHNIDKEADSLQKFYVDVQRRAEGITAIGRQALVVELYDKFFRNAFPTLTQKLGIVYTPVEVVDFIIHSVNDVLQAEFGQTLGSAGVHILDPFTGTGTFITRLLQSGLIKPHELEHKYRHEIHANEIVLLAYYIAAINIEAVYHDMAPKDAPYTPFEGICLTDTFQLYEQDHDAIANLLPDNSERRTKQKALDIRVIIGNPPYSAGQRSANDNAANITYQNLDESIRDSYVAQSTATNKNALYDSYIRAIRWATDRIKDKGSDAGVVAFVSNAGWIDGNATDGLRKCLVDEFSSLYVFHLRGNARTAGELRRKEKGNVFGEGTRTPVVIYLLVRNLDAQEFGKIHFHDIGDYLDQKQKLSIVKNFKSIKGITKAKGWQRITPDHNHDWLDQVDRSFERFIVLGDKKDKRAETVFENYSSGVKTQRDAWCYNASKSSLKTNIVNMITFYNSEVERYLELPNKPVTEAFIKADPTKISWTRALKWDLEKTKQIELNDTACTVSAYRPFQKQWLYFDRRLNEMVYQMPRIFPDAQAENRAICVSGIGARAGFSALMVDALPCLDMVEKGQCFPLKLYEPAVNAGAADDDLFAGERADGSHTHDGISDAGLAHFQAAYAGAVIDKEDLFYYIYGLLHAPDYRARFKNNLAKELPRIPAVKQAADFWAFSKAGRRLADLHVNYENVEPYPVVIKEGDLRLASIPDPEAFYRVTKMKYGGKGRDKDKTTVIYNPHITLTEIPLRAYDYVVNGKPALDWVMDRQCVKTDKASGIVNDANAYANETVGNPAYPLELFQRVITVSLETLGIVDGLPKLEID